MADQPRSRHFHSQRLKLHYVEWGAEDGRPLVLVHGGRDHCRIWDWFAARMAGDRRVIAPDLRGHGDSEWVSDGNYGLAAYGYDLLALIDHLGIGPTDVVSHSLGAIVTLCAAGMEPAKFKRIAAIEGLSRRSAAALEGLPVGDGVRVWIDRKRKLDAQRRRKLVSVEDAAWKLIEANDRLSEEQARHIALHGVVRNDDGSYFWKFDDHTRFQPASELSNDDLARLHGLIACPVLLVAGTDSFAPQPSRDQVSRFRDARIATFERAAHWVHHERLDELTACVRDFLGA